MSNVLIIASNYGLWAEELQGPWDALRKAGHRLSLATPTGKTPLPLKLSLDSSFVDPVQQVQVNTPEVVERVRQILRDGEWGSPIKIADATMGDYDAIVIVGGPGAPLDLTGNAKIHQLLVSAWQDNKTIGALCYAVGALVWARQPADYKKSIVHGKTIVAHPREWDFTADMSYSLESTTPDNPGTDIVTPGFVFPLRPIVEDAVGPTGRVISPPKTTRENPCVHVDAPFVTALSVESSQAFGQKLVEILGKST